MPREISAFFLILCLLFSPSAFAKPETPDNLARLIHERRGNWIALKGALTLEFVNSQGKKITCLHFKINPL